MAHHCEVVYDSIYPAFALPCDGTKKTIYENQSGRRMDGSVALDADPSPTPCTVTVIIKLASGRTITRSVTTSTSDFVGRAISVSGIRSVCVECSGGAPTDTCTGSVEIDLTYCRCCG